MMSYLFNLVINQIFVRLSTSSPTITCAHVNTEIKRTKNYEVNVFRRNITIAICRIGLSGFEFTGLHHQGI